MKTENQMDFSIKAFDTKNTIARPKRRIAVAVFENKKLSQAAKALDGAGAITAALKSGDITGKAGTTLLLRASKAPPPNACCWSAWAATKRSAKKALPAAYCGTEGIRLPGHERRYYRIAADRSERARRELGDPLRGAERPRQRIPHRWQKSKKDPAPAA
jgi:leucyl aminopeptidase